MVWTRAVSDRLRTSNFRSWSMKTFLANAFAVVCLATVQEFHLCRRNTNAPGWFSRSSCQFQKPQTEQQPLPSFHALIWRHKACFEHPNFIRVIYDVHPRPSIKKTTDRHPGCTQQEAPHKGDYSSEHQVSTTSFLTAATLIYAFGAGITAAAGTRLALQ